MSWTRRHFLNILNTPIAKRLFSDQEIALFTESWTSDNKAALLHANGITADSSQEEAKGLLQLVAAFSGKDLERIRELVFTQGVSTGARLDYLLPLHDEYHVAGEDVFVACVKIMVSGGEKNDVHLSLNTLRHVVGEQAGNPYNKVELARMEQYVNNAFAIRKTLMDAPNKSIIQPTLPAVNYMLTHPNTYRDSNENPVIVFIPGAISIEGCPVTKMVREAVRNGANIDDIGYFGVTGIVWSVILGDVSCVNQYLRLNARLDRIDELGNQHVLAWAAATLNAASSNTSYVRRMRCIIDVLLRKSTSNAMHERNHLAQSPSDYVNISQEKFTALDKSSQVLNNSDRPRLF